MTRDAFVQHVRTRVEESIRECEKTLGRSLPRKLRFQWISPRGEIVENGIEEEICRQVFVGPDEIYPCVDMGPWSEEGDRLLICAIRAGYPPEPFRKNWAGGDGPFILVRGGDLAREKHA
jgi:hypothetical protein